jgi:hypothetical protein
VANADNYFAFSITSISTGMFAGTSSKPSWSSKAFGSRSNLEHFHQICSDELTP